jgi:predicted amidophosphoribosyltransferase
MFITPCCKREVSQAGDSCPQCGKDNKQQAVYVATEMVSGRMSKEHARATMLELGVVQVTVAPDGKEPWNLINPS